MIGSDDISELCRAEFVQGALVTFVRLHISQFGSLENAETNCASGRGIGRDFSGGSLLSLFEDVDRGSTKC